MHWHPQWGVKISIRRNPLNGSKKAAPSPTTVKAVGKLFPFVSWLDRQRQISDPGWLWIWRRLISYRRHWEGMSPDWRRWSVCVRAVKWGHLIADAASLTASLTGSYLSVLSDNKVWTHLYQSSPLPRWLLQRDAFVAGRFHLHQWSWVQTLRQMNQ